MSHARKIFDNEIDGPVIPSVPIEDAKEIDDKPNESFLNIEKGYVPIETALPSKAKVEHEVIKKEVEKQEEAIEDGHKNPVSKIVSRVKKAFGLKKHRKSKERVTGEHDNQRFD